MATDEQLDEFVRWRDKHPDHAKALAEARQLWTSIGAAMIGAQAGRVDAASKYPRFGRRRLRQAVGGVRERVRSAGRAVGGSAVAAAAVLLMMHWPLADIKSGDRVHSVTLADGSSAILAPGTAMDADFRSSGRRTVTMKSGEAMFDVRHDPTRPFIVRSAQGYVRVLGTAFSVRLANGMTRVLVARGRVEIRSGLERRVLIPDQQVTYGLTTMGQIGGVYASDELGWTRHRLVLRNERVQDVIATIDHFDPRRIVLVNREVGARRIDALVDLRRVDSWLRALERSQGLSATELPGGIVILH